MDARSLFLASSVASLLAALLALRLRRAPTMDDQLWLAAVAASAGVELLLNGVTYDPGASDRAVIWATRAQVACICLHLAAWVRYSTRFLRLKATVDRYVVPLLVAGALLALVPGAVLTDRVASRPFALLGITYRDVAPSKMGAMVIGVLLAAVGVVLARFLRGWRAGVGYAGAHALVFAPIALFGANDALVVSGSYAGPYLIDLGWILPIAVLVVVTGGRVVDDARALTVLRDRLEATVAERTAALLASEARLHESRQLAALGRLAAGMAHALSNPIAASLGNLRLASQVLSRGPPLALVGDALDDATDAMERLGRLAGRMRDAAQLVASGGEASVIYVAEAVEAALARSGPSLAAAEVALDLEPGALVAGSPALIVQILCDLLANAAVARGAGRSVHIGVRARSAEGQVRIDVEDDGPGIDEATLGRLAESFFPREGSGIGLPFARMLARSLGGELELRSDPTRGTTATLSLPREVPI